MQHASRPAIAVGVALLAAAVTWGVGWWGVAPIGAVVGWSFRDVRGIAAVSALGSLLGWAVLLAADALGGRFGALAHVLAGTLGLPVVALVVLSLVLPAILGGSAAMLAAVAGSHLSDRDAGDAASHS